MTASILRLVLGDQLSPGLSSLRDIDPDRDVVLMAEVREEATYVRHHQKKIAFLFAAMRHFAEELRRDGLTVDYVPLDHPGNTGSLGDEVARAVKRHAAGKVVVTECGEWRLAEAMGDWSETAGVPLEIRTDDRFLVSRADFAKWADGRKRLRLEDFYREQRKRTGLLMDGDEPAGGAWNFDKENRKPPPGDLDPPLPMRFSPDETTREVLSLVEDRFGDHFGALEPFWFATTRGDARRAFTHFVKTALARFGDYQDAMVQDRPFLYHSAVSLYLNAGLLDPMEMCRQVEDAWRDGDVPINAAEGFIRQVIGWREYVRGVYWREMPDYETRNYLNARRDLPAFYWTGETDMNCLAQAIGQTRDEAYAHHIQRLMVTGNFALLAGVEPRQVAEWYLIVYADAYDWVELPNVHGMALFADGGLLATKPYAAGGNYIDRMSDYCGHCRYDVKKKSGPDACPFGYLYWNFLDANRERLSDNRRLAMPYRTLAKMSGARRKEIRDDARTFLDGLE